MIRGDAVRWLLGLCLPLFLAIPASVAEPDLPQVLPTPLPDPYVFRSFEEWTISGTGSSFYHGLALRPEAMTRKDLQLRYSDAAVRPAQGIWGFVPYRHRDGSWHGYATLHYGDFRTVVAHFLPESGLDWKPGKPIAQWRFAEAMAGGSLTEFSVRRARALSQEPVGCETRRKTTAIWHPFFNAPEPCRETVAVANLGLWQAVALRGGIGWCHLPIPLTEETGTRLRPRR